MDTQILRSKFFIPAERHDVIRRDALLARLNEGLLPGIKLILLCAPAGFGKTTLAREWITRLQKNKDVSKFQICWLTLDEGDNHTYSFLRYLIAVFQQVIDDVGHISMEWFKVPVSDVRDQVLAGLTNELAGSKRPVLLFLDDYHLIESEDVHHCVDFLLEHLPSHIHLLIMTRSNPPLPLARMRARGQMIEINLTDLRFNRLEIDTLFNQVMDYHLDEKQIMAVEQRTEGWITALQLLALSLIGKPDQAQLISAFTGSNRYLLDFLMEEVMGGLPADVQEFLLITSTLKGLQAELCDHITGRKDSRSVLERLEKDNLFIVPLDEERIWFRYHTLFDEFLLDRLRRRGETEIFEKEQVYHRRAADWLYEHGYLSEAIEQAFMAEDKLWAADIIEESTHRMYSPGEFSLLLRWLERLPRNYLLSRPRLCMAYAWALLLNGRFFEIQTYIDAVVDHTTEADAEVVGEAAIMRTLLSAYKMDIPLAITSAQEALKLLPEDNYYLRSLAFHNLGVAYEFMDDHELAFLAYENGWLLANKIDHVILKILTGTQLGDIRSLQGRMKEAENHYNVTLGSIKENDKNIPLAAMIYLGFARLYYDLNRIDEADENTQKSLLLSGKWESNEFLSIGQLFEIKVAYARGDKNRVIALLEQMEAFTYYPILSPMIVDYVKKLFVKVYIGVGMIEKASQQIEESGIYSGKVPPYLLEIDVMARARVFQATGNAEDASMILENALKSVQQTTKVLVIIEMLVLDAIAHSTLGHTDEAIEILKNALTRAENERIIRLFIDEGRPMLDLLLEMRRRGILGRFGEELAELITRECEPGRDSKIIKPIRPLNTFEPLSEREMEVLQLIAQGYSNKQIAEKLFVAITTIKTHVSNIYAKLGVTSRVQAAARAREMER